MSHTLQPRQQSAYSEEEGGKGVRGRPSQSKQMNKAAGGEPRRVARWSLKYTVAHRDTHTHSNEDTEQVDGGQTQTHMLRAAYMGWK